MGTETQNGGRGSQNTEIHLETETDGEGQKGQTKRDRLKETEIYMEIMGIEKNTEISRRL